MARKYKQNRRSVDKDSYKIYLRWRKELSEKGYHLSEKKSRKDFNRQYELLKADPEAKNKIRTLARNDIIISKTKEKKLIKNMMKPNGDKTFANYYNWDTGHFDFKGKSKRQLYWEIRNRKEAEGWSYGGSEPQEWETSFYRGRGLY